jgi:hypothetical protein
VSDIDAPADPDSAPEPEGSPRPPTRVPGVWAQIPVLMRVVLVLLLVIAGLGVYGVTKLTSESSASLDNGVIEQLIPADGDKLLQQASVGIDLQTGYTASLAVNGTAIPDDQLDKIVAFNRVMFQPGSGKVFSAWPAGKNCVVATYWKFETGPSQSSTRTWCFSVV